MKPVLLLLMLLVAISPQSADARVLTLDEALAIADEKNRDIASAREYGNYVKGKYLEERAAALPQFSLTASVAALRDDGQPAFAGGGSKQYDNRLGISVEQPLFTWGKIGAAVRAAEIGLKTAGEQLRLTQQAARRDVAAAYYNLLLANEVLRLSRENLLQKQRHSDEARKRLEAGVATDYDLLAADVALANARPEVIRGENRLRIAKERLCFLLALTEDVDAVGSLQPQTAPLPVFDEVLKIALARRPELIDIGYRIGVYDEMVTIAAADDKPRVDLKGGAGWHQMEFLDSRNDGAAWNIGVYLSYPFFGGFRTSGRVQQTRSERTAKEIEKQKLLDTVRIEARTALNDLQEAGEILAALSGTVEQAKRLLEMAEKGFEYGVKIRLEVDDAQTNLLQAETGRAKAAADYLTARVNLEWVMGRLGE